MPESDKAKILEIVHEDRETSILKEARRLKVDDSLKSPRNPFEIEEKSISHSIVSSDRDLDSISEDSEVFTSKFSHNDKHGKNSMDATRTKRKVK